MKAMKASSKALERARKARVRRVYLRSLMRDAERFAFCAVMIAVTFFAVKFAKVCYCVFQDNIELRGAAE